MSIKLNDITIRNDLRAGDLGWVVQQHGLLYSKEYGYGIEFESYVAHGMAEFFEQYDAGVNRVWVCEHDEKIVGFLLLMNRGREAQLRYFIILPAYRGIGLGNKLMGLYMDFLKQCNYTSSYLWTTSDLCEAAHLYIKYGFRLMEEKPSAAFGKPVVEQRYEWTAD